MSNDRAHIENGDFPLNIRDSQGVVEGAQVKSIQRHTEQSVKDLARRQADEMLKASQNKNGLLGLLQQLLGGIGSALVGGAIAVGTFAVNFFADFVKGVGDFIKGIGDAFRGGYRDPKLDHAFEPDPHYKQIAAAAGEVRESVDAQINEKQEVIKENIAKINDSLEESQKVLDALPETIDRMVTDNASVRKSLADSESAMSQIRSLNNSLGQTIQDGINSSAKIADMVKANADTNKELANQTRRLDQAIMDIPKLNQATVDAISAAKNELKTYTDDAQPKILARVDEKMAAQKVTIDGELSSATQRVSDSVEELTGKTKIATSLASDLIPRAFGETRPEWSRSCADAGNGVYRFTTKTTNANTASNSNHVGVSDAVEYRLVVKAKSPQGSTDALVIFVQDDATDGGSATSAVASAQVYKFGQDAENPSVKPFEGTGVGAGLNLGVPSSNEFQSATAIFKLKPGTARIRVGRMSGSVGLQVGQLELAPNYPSQKQIDTMQSTAIEALGRAQYINEQLWGDQKTINGLFNDFQREQSRINAINNQLWGSQDTLNKDILAIQKIHSGLWSEQSKLNEMLRHANEGHMIFEALQAKYNETNDRNWLNQSAVNDYVSKTLEGHQTALDLQAKLNDETSSAISDLKFLSKLSSDRDHLIAETTKHQLAVTDLLLMTNRASLYIPENSMTPRFRGMPFTGQRGNMSGMYVTYDRQLGQCIKFVEEGTFTVSATITSKINAKYPYDWGIEVFDKNNNVRDRRRVYFQPSTINASRYESRVPYHATSVLNTQIVTGEAGWALRVCIFLGDDTKAGTAGNELLFGPENSTLDIQQITRDTSNLPPRPKELTESDFGTSRVGASVE